MRKTATSDSDLGYGYGQTDTFIWNRSHMRCSLRLFCNKHATARMYHTNDDVLQLTCVAMKFALVQDSSLRSLWLAAGLNALQAAVHGTS